MTELRMRQTVGKNGDSESLFQHDCAIFLHLRFTGARVLRKRIPHLDETGPGMGLRRREEDRNSGQPFLISLDLLHGPVRIPQ